MIIPYVIVIISFILDTLIMKYIPFQINQIILFPMFLLIGLTFSYYYIKNTKKFITLSLFSGIMIDIIWNNTGIIYSFVYVIIGFYIIFLNKLFSINIINFLVETILVIIVENLIIFFILIILNVIDNNLLDLLIKIMKSIPLSILYAIILYGIFYCLEKKKKLRKRY